MDKDFIPIPEKINKPRKKKVKKLSFKVKWFRFKDRHPRLFVHLFYIAGGVLFALLLLTAIFFRKLDEYQDIMDIFK